MNYYGAYPRQTTFANVRELMAHGLAMQGSMMAPCREQGRECTDAYIVAVHVANDIEW